MNFQLTHHSRYFFYATDERKKDDSFDGSDTESENDGDNDESSERHDVDMDEETEDEDDDGVELPAEQAAWLKPSQDEAAATAENAARFRSLKDNESDTESERTGSPDPEGSDTEDEDDGINKPPNHASEHQGVEVDTVRHSFKNPIACSSFWDLPSSYMRIR